MNKYLQGAAIAALSIAIAAPASALEWNVSVWGKRRAFTEHVEKLAELVAEKTNGEFTMNISYGGLSKNTENLDGISIGAFEMAQFCAGYHEDKNPSITVLELPFLGVRNLEEEVALSHAVYEHPAVKEACERVTVAMGGRGRVLLRKSGTEPLVRVMVEGEDEALVAGYADELAKLVAEVCA